MTTSERLFFGFALPGAARRAVEGAVRTVPALPGRATPPDNLHLTLRFLGDTPSDRKEALLLGIGALAPPAPITARMGGWGAFPRPAAARVLWIGVQDEHSKLAELAGLIERLARESGFEPEIRPFRPHITVARARRQPVDLRRTLAEIPTVDVRLEIDQVTLFRSTLGAGPPRYEPIGRLLLAR